MSTLSFRQKLDSATIERLAEKRLHGSPYFFLKGVRCRVDHGLLRLQGRVPLSALKQFAEVIVRRVEGVRSVVNEIEIVDPQQVNSQRASGT
jgi:osmotically-inducible protein OsmY